MMSKPDDGGPAFPIADHRASISMATGMTLRDWFAGQALANLPEHGLDNEAVARSAYEIADAMLAERGAR